MNITIEERRQGGVWGQLVGDAIGVPYENTLPDKLPRLPADLAVSQGWDYAKALAEHVVAVHNASLEK